MNHLLYHGILLAQENRLDSMSRRFRSHRTRIDGGDVVIGLLVLAGIVAVVWLLSYVMKLQDKGRGFSSPFGLFLNLCKAHGLPWRQRWLLWRLARSQRLRDPARLFLEQERYEPAHLPPSLRTRAAELKRLSERLFFQPEEEEDDHEGDGSDPAEVEQASTPLPPAGPAPTLDIPPWPPTAEKTGQV